MKIQILLGLIVAFVASTDALRCYKCNGVSSLRECRQPGNVVTCQSNEGSCELHTRRRGTSFMYYSECKATDACENNEANNPTDCDKTGPEEVCRCCCQTDLCDCLERPTTTPTPPSTTPSPVPDPTTTTEIPPVEPLFCERPPVWENGETICKNRDAKKYPVGTVCQLRCDEGFAVRERKVPITTCVKVNDDPASSEVEWQPPSARCVPLPGRCRDRPVWEDGRVSCDDESVGGGWNVGDQCSYICPLGQLLVGANVATCTVVINGETNTREFSFIGGPPCCKDPPLTCPTPDPWNGGTIECGDGLPNGRYELHHRCEYICNPGSELDEGEPSFTICRREDPSNVLNSNTVWLPRPPTCSEEFVPRCETPPQWEIGFVVCDEERPDGGWNQGDTCDYVCPEGNSVVGVNVTECLPTEVGGTNLAFRPGPPCCEIICNPKVPADILFVLDQSTSITADRWPKITGIVSDVIGRFDFTYVRFGVVVYGSGILKDKNIAFNIAQSTEDMQAKVKGIKYDPKKSGTHTVAALNYSRTDAFQQGFGDREEVPNFVIFITDGVSYDSVDLGNGRSTLNVAADKLHGVTIATYAVGVGDFNRAELEVIASNDDFIATTDDFDNLTQLLDDVTTVTCPKCPR